MTINFSSDTLHLLTDLLRDPYLLRTVHLGHGEAEISDLKGGKNAILERVSVPCLLCGCLCVSSMLKHTVDLDQFSNVVPPSTENACFVWWSI